jgi:hypothetical protein
MPFKPQFSNFKIKPTVDGGEKGSMPGTGGGAVFAAKAKAEVLQRQGPDFNSNSEFKQAAAQGFMNDWMSRFAGGSQMGFEFTAPAPEPAPSASQQS